MKTDNNNSESFTISEITNDMLTLLHDFARLQERVVTVYDRRTGGENIIKAAAEVYHLMQDALTANISDTLVESKETEL